MEELFEFANISSCFAFGKLHSRKRIFSRISGCPRLPANPTIGNFNRVLVLALVGLYCVISYAVTPPIPELGIHLAFSAQTSDVLRLVLSQGMTPALIGVGIGNVAALAFTRWKTSLLFEVNPADLMTFSEVALLLLLVALLACWIPARRATKVDPLVALRAE